MRRIIFILILTLTFMNVSGQDILKDFSKHDSLQYYKNKLSSKDSLYFTAFKIGQIFFYKATTIGNKGLKIPGDSMARNYPWNFVDSALLYLNLSIKLNKNFAPAFYYRGYINEFT